MISVSRLSCFGCKSGAIGMKLGGHSGHNRRFLPYLVHCLDTLDAVSRCRQAEY